MTSIRRAPTFAVALAALTATALGGSAGCSDEAIVPAAGTTASSTSSTGAGGGGTGGEGGTPDPGPKRRDVFYRNPVGTPFDNLLADGDFELSIVSEGQVGGQYGWVGFSPSGNPEMILAETGGLCRSGLRCARMEDGQLLFGRGTAAPDDAGHVATIWMKPTGEVPIPREPCDLADVYVIRCDTFEVKKKLDVAAAPDEGGWCQLTEEMTSSRHALCVYAELKADVLVDQATLLPQPDRDAQAHPAATDVPTAEQRARMAIVQRWIRNHLGFSGGRPSGPFDPERAKREWRGE